MTAVTAGVGDRRVTAFVGHRRDAALTDLRPSVRAVTLRCAHRCASVGYRSDAAVTDSRPAVTGALTDFISAVTAAIIAILRSPIRL